MKKFIIFTLIFTTYLFSNNISWYASYDKALQVAHKEKKNLMILITSSKDKKSNEVLKNYFMNQDYIKYINNNFISVLVNVDYKDSYPIELFYTTSFPSLFFASYKDELFLTHPIYEFTNQEDFKKILYSIDYK